MKTEYECTLLDINREELIKRLEELGAVKEDDYFQRRYVYDMKPVQKSKWIRLRTNGKKTMLAIKNVADRNLIGGTKELEMEVSNFDVAKNILSELGYEYRVYQENKRTIYNYKDIEISIDKWPMIPEYCEIEGNSEKSVKEFVNLLNLNYKVTNYDVESICKEIYGTDIEEYKELKFEE